MNLEQILPENIELIINQIKLSLESDLTNKYITKESADQYSFDIEPKIKKNSYDDTYKFVVSIKKKTSSVFWIDTSTYEMLVKIKRSGSSYNWYDKDEFKISDKNYSKNLQKIYELVDDEHERRDIADRNKKMVEYIDLIKTTVKPEFKRDESIEEILN